MHTSQTLFFTQGHYYFPALMHGSDNALVQTMSGYMRLRAHALGHTGK